MHIAFLLPDQGAYGGARQYMCTMLQSLPPEVHATIIIPDGPLERVLSGFTDDCLIYPSPRRNPLENPLRPIDKPFEGITIETSARLEPEKDLSLLLEAVANVARQTRVRLIIAGEGSLRESLEKQASSLGINACFLGFVPDIARRMSSWDIFCLPSYREPFGFSIAEAMANGLPVVAARAGGPQEIVDDGHTGLMFQPGDKDALAGALLSLCRDRERRASMGNAGREKYERCFCAEAMANATLDVFREAACRRGLRKSDA